MTTSSTSRRHRFRRAATSRFNAAASGFSGAVTIASRQKRSVAASLASRDRAASVTRRWRPSGATPTTRVSSEEMLRPCFDNRAATFETRPGESGPWSATRPATFAAGGVPWDGVTSRQSTLRPRSRPAVVAADTRPALAPRGALTTSMTTISSPIVAIFEAEMFARASANTLASVATWPVASGPQAVTTRCASFAARRGAGPAGTSL
mmetsp:Transcript_11648/g.35832  ORF Transcript_11648/g.35832 Transcript_11648/m.35832 type:complete len:208 (-) Transcript_11648:921-1544(-)